MKNRIVFETDNESRIGDMQRRTIEGVVRGMPVDFVTPSGEYPDFVILQRWGIARTKYLVKMPARAEVQVHDNYQRCSYHNIEVGNGSHPRAHGFFSYEVIPGQVGNSRFIYYGFLLVDRDTRRKKRRRSKKAVSVENS